MNSASKRFVWFALLLAAAVLRFADLGRASYQIDEVVVVQESAGAKSYGEIYDRELNIFQTRHRLPLLFWVVRLACGLSGQEGPFYPEWIARLPMAMMGLAAVVLLYLIGKRLGGEGSGYICMALGGVSTYGAYYAREAYDYGIVMFAIAGVIWSGLRLLDGVAERGRVTLRDAWPFAAFSVLVIHAHLSNLLFLPGWQLALVVLVVRRHGWRFALKSSVFPAAVLVFALAYLSAGPFLLKLVTSGFVTTESTVANRFTLAAIPAVLGRVTFGETPLRILAAVALVAVALWRGHSPGSTSRLVALAATGLFFFMLQSWALRVSRFEIRYYTALWPILTVLMGVGAHRIWQMVLLPRPAFVRLAGAAAGVGLWLWMAAPSCWAVVQLDCRGYNYKGIARWMQENLPEGGIYSWWNVYDARGVPQTYATPGRYMAYPLPWSSAEDYVRFRVKDRLTSFFQRFPNAVLVETAPADLLDPPKATYVPINRDELFARQEWIVDEAFQRLIDLHTSPQGEAQWESRFFHKFLISHTPREELPVLMQKQRRPQYSYFAPDWAYAKDRQMNDWMIASHTATLWMGNAASSNVLVRLALRAAAPPAGCRVNIYSADGRTLLQHGAVGSQVAQVLSPPVELPPGESKLTVEVLPAAGQLDAQLLVAEARAVVVSP